MTSPLSNSPTVTPVTVKLNTYVQAQKEIISRLSNNDKTTITLSSKEITKLHNQAKANTKVNDKAEKEIEDKKDEIDKAIEQLQKQIKVIQRQIKELGNDDSESTKQIRDALLTQIIELNGKLMLLIQKKINMMKMESQMDGNS